ncbi:DUF5013 domain-containing protein [Bacteroides sp. AN502(2024)]|uniref:DUF5013 domain-containing protein n=1 Tax=Bacteroides sp. AN502(2024) TaxID=3160599 RepID=UPI003517BC1E
MEAEWVGEPTNEAVTVKVPATLSAGTYQIAVSTSFETIEKTLDYTVLPMPEVTGLSVAAGYINAEVIISGKNFGDKAEDIQVKFGETACEAVTLNKDGHIVVNVPKGIPTGENAITLTVLGMTIDMSGHGTFEVWETPEITGVETPYVYPYGTLVKAGEEITFIGHGFGTNKDAVTVTFDGVTAPVEVNSVTSIAIAVNVPAGFTGGKVTMLFAGIDEPVLSDELAPLPADGDISRYALQNYKQPFDYVREGGKNGDGFSKGGEWAKAVGWTLENSKLQDREGGCAVDLAFSNKGDTNGGTGLALQTDWGFDNPKNNGKIYQKTTLQRGRYRLTAHVYEYGNGKRFTGYIAVCAGDKMLDTDDVPAQSLAHASITATGDVVTEFSINEKVEVVIGFVATIVDKQGRAKINEFKLEMIE